MKKEELSVWLLSVVPLLVSAILHAAVGNSSVVFTIVFILNILFISCDYFRNRKLAGYPLYIYISGLIFVPLYIYFRTIKDGHQYKFLAAWLVLYILDLAILQMAI